MFSLEPKTNENIFVFLPYLSKMDQIKIIILNLQIWPPPAAIFLGLWQWQELKLAYLKKN